LQGWCFVVYLNHEVKQTRQTTDDRRRSYRSTVPSRLTLQQFIDNQAFHLHHDTV